MNSTIHVIHVEGNPRDAERVRAELADAEFMCRITRVQTSAQLDTAIQQGKPDVVLADYRLPKYDGMSALERVHALYPDVPFIFVSGTMGEEAAIEGLTHGAVDYVLKSNLTRLGPAVRRAFREARSQWENKLRARDLEDSEAKMRSIVESIGIGVSVISPNMEILELNRCMRQWFPGIDPTQHPICYESFNTPPRREVCAYCPTCKTLVDGQIHEAMTETPQDGRIRNYRVISTPLRNAAGEVVAAIEMVEDITARQQAQDELQRSNDLLRAIIEAAPVAIIGLDLDGLVRSVWNPAAEGMLGWTAQEAMGRPLPSVPTDRQEEFRKFREQIRNGMTLDGVEVRRQRRDGTPIDYSIYASPLHDNEGRISGNIAVLVDITEHKRFEERMRQTQKMEAIGQLAGGVAHDFNNMLGVIIGSAEMALEKEALDESLRRRLEEILAAGYRSADITQQLLAFARRQTITPEIIDLNMAVNGMLKLLRRLIGESIDLTWAPGAKLWPVKMDPCQVDQILANLCVNARDAVSGVGTVTIETQNVKVDDQYSGVDEVLAHGKYVKLAVSDDGIGMDKQTVARIFEPFFTTKEVGKGSGLGLATVYGIVKQNAGFITVHSEPGDGSTFEVFLPRYIVKTDPTQKASPAARTTRESETILVVEDGSAAK